MFCCYIIYSPSFDKFYIGETEDFQKRLLWHNSKQFTGASTKYTADWEEYLILECRDRSHARKVESFIKRQKSRRFIMRLKEVPDLAIDIVNKY